MDSLHPFLQDVINQFEQHCTDNDIDYNIARDEPNSQMFHILQQGLEDFIDKLHGAIKDKPVVFTSEKTQDGMKFTFEIKPLKEVGTIKDIPKWVLDDHGVVEIANTDAPVKIKQIDVNSMMGQIQDHPHYDMVKEEAFVIDENTKPIILLEGQLVDGYKRVIAFHKAGINTIPSIELSEVLQLEDQMKSPTKAHKLRQRPFRSSMSIQECASDMVLVLRKPLLCYDNKTTIPSGSKIVIYDNDKHVPDIWWNGRVINVSRDNLDYALNLNVEERIEYRMRLEEEFLGFKNIPIYATINQRDAQNTPVNKEKDKDAEQTKASD